MSAIRFYCRRCNAPLVTLEPGKTGRCPRCKEKITAPKGLPVSQQDAYGRILSERDWHSPDETVRALSKFSERGATPQSGTGEASATAPGLFTPEPDLTSLRVLQRIEEKLNRISEGYCPAEWVSIKDAARITGLSSSHVRRAILANKLPAANVATPLRPLWRIARKDLTEWMEKKKGETVNVPPSSELKELIERHLPGLRGRKDSATR